ncbi:MAG TPA: LysM peptidoglycan-binding domain-containing protein [Peptococcaceae bacterium]|jgi:LysM repeat protein|nr:LysM peptidoglycan-binding domain-containing protein [Peptococcaceae bacterium]HPZ71479.1 LysM peptidoglycan-binding domain-containing protein [Peptococcaceae bacterium]HQD53815.1 LysM peptidoglycan-binding domain-containing protein [Peptococcaceae bacterium]
MRRRKRPQRKPFCLILVMLIFLVILIQATTPLTLRANTPTQIITVIVEEGDTLWAIARQYRTDQQDIRKYIDLIQEYNGKSNPQLQPGEALAIPVY